MRQTYAHVNRRKKRRDEWRIVLLISSFHQEFFISEALGAVENGWAKSCMRVCYSVNESDPLGCMAGSSLRTARQQSMIRGTTKQAQRNLASLASASSQGLPCQFLSRSSSWSAYPFTSERVGLLTAEDSRTRYLVWYCAVR